MDAPLGRKQLVIVHYEVSVQHHTQNNQHSPVPGQQHGQFEALPDHLLFLDGSGTIESCNLDLRTLDARGGQRSPLLLEDLLPLSQRVEVRKALHSVIEGQAAPVLEWSLPGDSGRSFRCQLSQVPQLEQDAQFRILAVVRDVTREGDLQRRLDACLSQTAHHQRLDLAAELSASIAHELNQPLTAISLQSEVLLARWRQLSRTTDASGAHAFEEGLRDMFEQADRARDIIGSLRALVSGDDLAEAEETHVDELVGRVERLTATELQRRGVRVQCDVSRYLLPIHARATQIEQVLFNLLFNGADAMRDTPEEQRRLQVAAFLDEDGRHIRLSVRDHGSGIPEANRERIFERFFTTKTDGMGMGLALCRSIVEAHGGHIWAEPASDGGTWMHLRLPVITTAEMGWTESLERASGPQLECVES